MVIVPKRFFPIQLSTESVAVPLLESMKVKEEGVDASGV